MKTKKKNRRNRFEYRKRMLKNINNKISSGEPIELECVDMINFNNKTYYIIYENSNTINARVITINRRINNFILKDTVLINKKLAESVSREHLQFIIGHELGHVYLNEKYKEDGIYEIKNKRKRRIMNEVLCDLFSIKYNNFGLEEIEMIMKEDDCNEIKRRMRFCRKMINKNIDNLYNDYKRYLLLSEDRYEKMISLMEKRREYIIKNKLSIPASKYRAKMLLNKKKVLIKK